MGRDISFSRLADLSRTGSFRQALLFLGLFGAGSLTVFGFLYLQTQHFVTRNIDDWLHRESARPFAMQVRQVEQEFAAHVANRGAPGHIFTLFGPDHQVVAGDHLAWPAQMNASGKPFNFVTHVVDRRLRYRGIAHALPDGNVILLAQDLYESREFDEAFVSTAAWGAMLTLALALVGAVLVGAGTIKRLDGVARAIQAIVNGDLSQRLPLHGTSADLDRLASVVNGMLDDIERLMHDIKGVTDGIAHDLRTPLTRILAGLERAQRRARTPEEFATAIDSSIEEIRGVLKTFSALLRISELEDGARRRDFAVVDMTEIARDVVEFYEPVAEEKQVTLLLTRSDTPVSLTGDSSLLFDALANLVDNALKFTPAGGVVAVGVQQTGLHTEIFVSDTGSALPRPTGKPFCNASSAPSPAGMRPATGWDWRWCPPSPGCTG